MDATDKTRPYQATSAVDVALDEVGSLLQRGARPEAELKLRQILERFPDASSAHRVMASLASQTGRKALALQHMQQACELSPGSGKLRCELGCLQAHYGLLPKALENLQAATTLAPELVDGWYFLGISLVRLDRPTEALAPLRHARILAPAQPKILEALANAEFTAGFPADALPLWQEITAARPSDIDAMLKLGETLSRLGYQGQALSTYTDGIRRLPGSADLWMALAQAQEDDGDRDAAMAAYEQALALRPGWAFPLSGLLGLLRGKAPVERVHEAGELLASISTPDADRALLGYELGKVHDSRGEYSQAMDCWHVANAARSRMIGNLDVDAYTLRAEQTIQAFNGESFSRALPGSQDQRPVFIVGMPRSGTTLTEQIIGSHPLAFGCGELPDIALIAKNLAANTGPWPGLLPQLDAASLQWAIERYLAAATRHADAGVLRLIDKAPTNYHLLGLIALMFPQSRVIWCRRNPRDIAVSIYGENFSLSEQFATSFAGIGHGINLQNRLMRHWQSVLPIPILELQYETLAASIEQEARRVIDFVGLPWDPACLDFHRSERGVQTPSRWQVRQPVHTRSIGRWRNYAFALQPLLDVLETGSS